MRIEQADEQDFAELSEWRYELPYDFYDGNVDPVLNADRYFVARADDDELIGFYYFERRGDELEYGLGLRPGLVGRGHGLEFVRVGLEFGRSLFGPKRIVLNVAVFNVRAIKVYERAGFRETGRHVRSFDRFGDVEFITMEERV